MIFREIGIVPQYSQYNNSDNGVCVLYNFTVALYKNSRCKFRMISLTLSSCEGQTGGGPILLSQSHFADTLNVAKVVLSINHLSTQLIPAAPQSASATSQTEIFFQSFLNLAGMVFFCMKDGNQNFLNLSYFVSTTIWHLLPKSRFGH